MKLNYFVLICALFMPPVFSQTATIDITGNLVNDTQTATPSVSTWQNGKFVNELNCWKGGDPDCSAGQPYIRPGSNINFSYGYTELYQVVNVSKALPNSGTGLVTTGFTFSWRSKNGNGWDDGRLDELKAYVQGYTKSGQWIENFNYNLNFIHDWTDFSWNENWSKLRRPNDLANIVFGFAGKDNNYWMGPYGPEITNVNFQLKYKPDPCVNNPLYSPECPKFQETLQKNLASTTTTTSDTIKPQPEFDTQQSFNNPPPPKSDERIFMGEKEDGVYEESLVDINRLIDTLIKIEDNQIREQQITMDAATTAISETEKISSQTVKQAEQVASKAVKQSIEIGMISQQQTLQDQTSKENKSQQSLSLFQAPTTISTEGFKLPGAQNNQMSVKESSNAQTQKEAVQSAPQQTNTFQLQVTQTQKETVQSASQQTNMMPPQVVQAQKDIPLSSVQEVNKTESNQMNKISNTSNEVVSISTSIVVRQEIQPVNIPTESVASTNSQYALISPTVNTVSDIPTTQSNFLTNKADPINSIIESKSNVEERKEESNTLTVNRNTQNNEAAGNVDIASIAIQPPGFNQYASLVLRDAAFYAPKEIYRGQRTVDNARALRQLASDRLHQEMVDQQYLQR